MLKGKQDYIIKKSRRSLETDRTRNYQRVINMAGFSSTLVDGLHLSNPD